MPRRAGPIVRSDRRSSWRRSTTRWSTTTARGCRSMPEIFARWMREAEDYRTEAMKERRAELGLDLRLDAAPDHRPVLARRKVGKAPLALFIHGGYWRSLDPSHVQPHGARAQRPRRHGRGRRLQSLPAGHASPTSSTRCGTRCCFSGSATGQRVMVYGHSAGGHLAAAMVAHRLARALSQDAARPGAGRLFDLRRVRSHPAGRASR